MKVEHLIYNTKGHCVTIFTCMLKLIIIAILFTCMSWKYVFLLILRLEYHPREPSSNYEKGIYF